MPGNHGRLGPGWACCGRSPSGPPRSRFSVCALILFATAVTGLFSMLLHGPHMDGRRKTYGCPLGASWRPRRPESRAAPPPHRSCPCPAHLLPVCGQAAARGGPVRCSAPASCSGTGPGGAHPAVSGSSDKSGLHTPEKQINRENTGMTMVDLEQKLGPL